MTNGDDLRMFVRSILTFQRDDVNKLKGNYSHVFIYKIYDIKEEDVFHDSFHYTVGFAIPPKS